MLLCDCELLLGQQTDAFARNADAAVRAQKDWSLSLRTKDRTIDLVAASLEEYVCIVRVFARFMPVRAQPQP